MTPDDGAGREVSRESFEGFLETPAEAIEEDLEHPAHETEVAKRLAATVAGLAIYALLERLPLPGLAPLEPGTPPFILLRARALAVGITPLAAAFVLVELFALSTAAGRRLRDGGTTGRARLTRSALLLGLGLALLQGFSISEYLSHVVTPYGLPYVTDPGPGFILLATLTLTAGTAGVWVLARLISQHGLGNGFCLIIAFGLLQPVERFIRTAREPFVAALPAITAALLLVLHISRVERGEVEEGAPALPALPQGILPASAAALILGCLRFMFFFQPRHAVPPLPAWAEPVLFSVVIPLLSWPVYLLVSGPRTLGNELKEFPEEAVWVSTVLRGRLKRSTLVLSLGTAAWAAWAFWQSRSALPMTFVGVAMVVATILDLLEEARFTARHGRAESLLSLDDVYRARHLVTTLQDAGIAALPRARRFRSLFFWFFPLVKIEVLVASESLAEARRVFVFDELRDF